MFPQERFQHVANLTEGTGLSGKNKERRMLRTGWTRTEVAAVLHVTPRTLYNWEREGKILAPERDRRGWRRYTGEQVAALRLLVGDAAPAELPGMEYRMELSARNKLAGTVKSIKADGITAEVILDLGHGLEIVSVITRDSVERLGLKVGDAATAIVKSTEVMIGK
jgi:molybdopterin-binding protein